MEKNEGDLIDTDKPEYMPATTKPTRRSLWVIFMLLLSMAGLGWFIYTQHQQKVALIAQLDNKVGQHDLTKLRQWQDHHLTQLKQQQAVAHEDVLKSVVALAKKVDILAKRKHATSDEVVQLWALAEVEFLLSMASYSVLLTKDIDSAITALTAADNRLAALDDPRLYRLRSLINDEKLALMAVARADIAGLAAQLQSAINAVDSLRLPVQLNPTNITDDTDSTTQSANKADNQQGLLSSVWKEVKSLVVVRRQAPKDIALLAPQSQYLLRQNLRLKLETARLSLLSGRQVIFHDSLATAEKWLQRYFVGAERDALLTIISALKSQSINQALPDISASSRWLQQYQDTQ